MQRSRKPTISLSVLIHRIVIGVVVGQLHDCGAGAEGQLVSSDEFVRVVSVCDDYEFNDNYEVIGDAVTS